MTQIAYTAFFPEVLPYLPSVPELAAENAIRNACIEFCTKTGYLQEDIAPINVTAGTASYIVTPLTAGYRMGRIISARIGTTPLPAYSPDDMLQMYGDTWSTKVGKPVIYTQIEDDIIRLFHIPDENLTDQLQLRITLVPMRTSDTVDAVLLERWAEVIAFGARARLHDTPAQAYTDEAQAKKFRAYFESGYGDALIDVSRGRVNRNLSVRMRRFV